MLISRVPVQSLDGTRAAFWQKFAALLYNCTKCGNWSIDNVTAAHYTLHISILQLLKL